MMRTTRNVIGSILALAGAAAAVWSPFRIWYDGRHGRDYRIEELFTGTGVTEAGAELFGSLLLPFAVAALVTLVGVVLRSRVLVSVAGLIVIAFTVLWMVRVGQAEGSLTVDGDGGGLGVGAGTALVGGVVLLIAALLLAGRRSRRAPEHEPYDDGYGAPARDDHRHAPPQDPSAEPPHAEPWDRPPDRS